MACENCNSHDELRSVTRLQNKALRTVNRLLRRRQEQIQTENDRTVCALFEAPSAAEFALKELWERAELQCSPEDYQWIVDVAVEALKASKSQVVPATSSH